MILLDDEGSHWERAWYSMGTLSKDLLLAYDIRNSIVHDKRSSFVRISVPSPDKSMRCIKMLPMLRNDPFRSQALRVFPLFYGVSSPTVIVPSKPRAFPLCIRILFFRKMHVYSAYVLSCCSAKISLIIKKRHTTAGIRWSPPTQLLIRLLPA